MDLAEGLLIKGWHLSATGLDICKEGLDRISHLTVIEKALDTDLREIGEAFLSEEIQKEKADISGPCVLQIQKLKNVASPKYETSNNHPVLLRLLLTDGHTYISCLQWDLWKSVTLDTPPGSKLFIKSGKVQIQNGFLLLKDSNFILLGGHVTPMVDKWELSKQFALHQRRTQGSEEGPPPWIPFGKSINYKVPKVPTGNFRSLEPESKKEEKEDVVFKQQRQANIAEISRSKEGVRKVFGGGKDHAANESVVDSSSNSYVQDKKHFNVVNNSDVRKKGSPPQNFQSLEKNQHFRSTDSYQRKSHDYESANYTHKNSRDYHYNNSNNFQQQENNHYAENAKFGKANNTSQETLFYRNPTTDFCQENKFDDNLVTPNFSSGHSRFQARGNRHENHSNSFFNAPINPNVQDRYKHGRTTDSFQEESRSNFNSYNRNSHGNRRTTSRREETTLPSKPPPYTYEENDFPIPNSNPDRNHFSGVWEFRRGGNRPFIHRNDENHQDRLNDGPPRQGHRPPIRLYQPSWQRQG